MSLPIQVTFALASWVVKGLQDRVHIAIASLAIGNTLFAFLRYLSNTPRKR